MIRSKLRLPCWRCASKRLHQRISVGGGLAGSERYPQSTSELGRRVRVLGETRGGTAVGLAVEPSTSAEYMQFAC